MKKFKPQHSRLLFIDKKIREKSFPNKTTLANEWEVSSKTIQRDLDYMRTMLDAPLAYDAQKRGYYYTEENFHLPAMALNDSDLFAIFIAGKVLQQYENTPIYRKLKSLFAKIEESLPEKVSIAPALLDDRFSFFGNPLSKISEDVWETVFTALRVLKTIEITYAKPGAAHSSKRMIDPYHVISFQGEWYVIAFCHSRDDIRTFALSRIATAQLADHYFAIPDDFDFKQTARNRFGVQWTQEEHDVKIWFSRQAAPYIQERKWHREQHISQNQDGSIFLSFSASHLLEVKRWVLSWGDMARVVAPKKLTENIQKELLGTLQHYGVYDDS